MRDDLAVDSNGRTAVEDESIRLRTILAPIDFSDEAMFAFRHASRLAEEVGGKVIALNVVESPNIYPAYEREEEEKLEGEAQHKLDQMCQTEAINPDKVETMVRLAAESVSEEILAAARDVAADLIVVPVSHLAVFRHALFGHTVDKIVRHAPCPVLMVPVPSPAAERIEDHQL
jgi:nucleotide-binding universal stress UspA family protein